MTSPPPMRPWMCLRALGAWLMAGLLACVPVAAVAAQPSSVTPATPAACPPALAPAAATGPATDRGFLWRLTRDGRTSWLFGTLHVGRPDWVRFGPRLSAALQASDLLALEVDPGDPGLQQALAEAEPPPPLPTALQARLDQAHARACIDRRALAALHPLLQVGTLTLLEARWLGLDPGHAQERLLATAVRASGRPVVALETVAQQKAALMPASGEDALQALAQSLSQLEDHSGRRVLARLVGAWERGELAALDDFERWCECAATEADRAALRRLNDDRNPALADGIEAQHRRGLRVFAAVGALHMIGPAALPRLLAERGFRVERVPMGP